MKNIKLIIVFILGMLAMYGISNAYKLNASLVTYDKKNTTLESEDVQGAIDELENDVINRKNQIIEALINKGVNLDETANYDEIISGINSIEGNANGIILKGTAYAYGNNLGTHNFPLSLLNQVHVGNNFTMDGDTIICNKTMRYFYSAGVTTESGETGDGARSASFYISLNGTNAAGFGSASVQNSSKYVGGSGIITINAGDVVRANETLTANKSRGGSKLTSFILQPLEGE